jgi:hypothetical protein
MERLGEGKIEEKRRTCPSLSWNFFARDVGVVFLFTLNRLTTFSLGLVGTPFFLPLPLEGLCENKSKIKKSKNQKIKKPIHVRVFAVII